MKLSIFYIAIYYTFTPIVVMNFDSEGLKEIQFQQPTHIGSPDLDIKDQNKRLRLSLNTARRLKTARAYEPVSHITSRRVLHRSHNVQVTPFPRLPLTRVDRSSIHGFGLFAAKPIKKD